MTNPHISVVIPCYNDGKYLPETIAKLKQQTYLNFEIIVVNDGSTDEATINYLNTLTNDDQITVINQSNARMSAARNTGATHAKGIYIAALDADDYFDNTFFAKALAVFEQAPQTAVVTSYIRFFGNKTGSSKPRGGSAANFLFSNQCPACAMVKKSVWDEVGGYDEAMKMGYEDWEFYIRITKKNWNVHVIPEHLLFYRQTNKSTLANDTLPNRATLIDYIVDKHKDWYLNNLKTLIHHKEVIYTENRVSFQYIWKFIKNRITKNYK
jgi:glycosyltransferase involved in cell wall biosynthesis